MINFLIERLQCGDPRISLAYGLLGGVITMASVTAEEVFPATQTKVRRDLEDKALEAQSRYAQAIEQLELPYNRLEISVGGAGKDLACSSVRIAAQTPRQAADSIETIAANSQQTAQLSFSNQTIRIRGLLNGSIQYAGRVTIFCDAIERVLIRDVSQGGESHLQFILGEVEDGDQLRVESGGFVQIEVPASQAAHLNFRPSLEKEHKDHMMEGVKGIEKRLLDEGAPPELMAKLLSGDLRDQILAGIPLATLEPKAGRLEDTWISCNIAAESVEIACPILSGTIVAEEESKPSSVLLGAPDHPKSPESHLKQPPERKGGRITIHAGIINSLDLNADGYGNFEGGTINVKGWLLTDAINASASGKQEREYIGTSYRYGGGGNGGRIYLNIEQCLVPSINLRSAQLRNGQIWQKDEAPKGTKRIRLAANGAGWRKRLGDEQISELDRANLNDYVNGCDGGSISVQHDQVPWAGAGVWARLLGGRIKRLSEIGSSAFAIEANGSHGRSWSPHFGAQQLDNALTDEERDKIMDSYELAGDTPSARSGGNGGNGGSLDVPGFIEQEDCEVDSGNGGTGQEGYTLNGTIPMRGGKGGDGGQPGRINASIAANGGNGGDGGRGSQGDYRTVGEYVQGRLRHSFEVIVASGPGGNGGDCFNVRAKPGEGGQPGAAPTNEFGRIQVTDESAVPAAGKRGELLDPRERTPENPDNAVPILATKPRLGLDRNRDGTIDFVNQDLTSIARPFQFWLNDNSDSARKDATLEQSDMHDRPAGSDCHIDEIINGVNDLQDLQRLWIETGVAEIASNEQVEILVKNHTGGALRLFSSVEEDGGLKYLYGDYYKANVYSGAQTATGQRQVQFTETGNHGGLTLTGAGGIPLPRDTFPVRNGRIYCLFEGIAPGLVELRVRIVGSVTTVEESDPLYVEIKPIKEMYSVLNLNSGKFDEGAAALSQEFLGEADTVPNINVRSGEGAAGNISKKTPFAALGMRNAVERSQFSSQDDDVVLFIHGWNMKATDKREFADIAFKRLWLCGYNGRFISVDWPTQFLTPAPESVSEVSNTLAEYYEAMMDPGNFNRSEEIAWRCGKVLANAIRSSQLETPGDTRVKRIHILAHSMGNIVAGEALRCLGPEAKEIQTYMASQGAVCARAWSSRTKQAENLLVVAEKRIKAHNVAVMTSMASSPSLAQSPQARRSVVDLPPDIMGSYIDTNQCYFARDKMPTNTRYYNYYNALDYSLTKWEWNARLRPNLRQGYYYSQELGYTKEDQGGWIVLDPKVSLERYAIFAYVATPYTLTMGVQALPVDRSNTDEVVWSKQRDLRKDLGFGDTRMDHSGQFLRPFAEVQEYWSWVLDDCRLRTVLESSILSE